MKTNKLFQTTMILLKKTNNHSGKKRTKIIETKFNLIKL